MNIYCERLDQTIKTHVVYIWKGLDAWFAVFSSTSVTAFGIGLIWYCEYVYLATSLCQGCFIYQYHCIVCTLVMGLEILICVFSLIRSPCGMQIMLWNTEFVVVLGGKDLHDEIT